MHALEVDLVGPYAEAEELDRAPSRFYLTGFLVPKEGRSEEPVPDPEEDTDSEDAEGEGEEDDATAEDVRPAGPGSRRKTVMPASLGLSVLLPPAAMCEGHDHVTILLRCAEYVPFHPEGAKKTTRPSWRRHARGPYEVKLSLRDGELVRAHTIPELPGISVETSLGLSSTPRPGTRALSAFVVNQRAQRERAGVILRHMRRP
ncbi:MAG TPA: hypothetical protein PKU97_25455, partial [Kofleriaceae bacterium]|nr:hypothetical protein [Kofleriaceae bacterium]